MPFVFVDAEAEELVGGGAPAVRVFVCGWAQRFIVASELIGRRVDIRDNQREVLECVPWRHPDAPGWYCHRVELCGVGPLGMGLVFLQAVVTAYFREDGASDEPKPGTWRDRPPLL